MANRYRYFFATRVLIVVLGAMLGALWYALLLWISSARFRELSSSSESVYLLSPDNYFFAIPALFLGLLSVDLPMRFLSSSYNLMPRLRRRSALVFGFVVCIVCFGFVGLALNTYIMFKQDMVVISGFLDLGEHRYLYSRIKSIEAKDSFTALSGRRVHRPHFLMKFDDGFVWNSRSLNYGRDPDPVRDAEVMQFAASKGGVAIAHDE